MSKAQSGEKQPTQEQTVKAKVDPRKLSGPEFCPMVHAQGKRLMTPSACVDFHPFAATLKEWETGVPVDCGVPWAWATVEAAIEKGAH
jgi:hypothetical protein